MPLPSTRDIVIHDPGPIPLPEPSHPPLPDALDPSASYVRALPEVPMDQRPTKAALEQLHTDGYVDFFNPKRFGLVESREHVVGFVPHQFAELPRLGKDGPPRRWRVERLELVSLLKHETPVVYVSEHFPRMNELRHAPTRPLDAFEERGLAALRKGTELEVEQFRDHLRMVGAIRAVQQCLRCHDAERGDLLGAFSYVLRPEPAGPVNEVQAQGDSERAKAAR